MRRGLKPRPISMVGIAMGLVVLWHFAPVLAPWLIDEPLARALIALGLAGFGALVAWLVLVVITGTWPRGSSKPAPTRDAE